MLGWVGTVTGFAVVLYSRLHLVTRNRRILRSALTMIVADAILLHIPTMVAQIGVIAGHHKDWIAWYQAVEKVQIVSFTVQETILSSIYVWATRKIVKESYNDRTKRWLRLLIWVQITCVSLDVPLVVLGLTDLFLIKVTLTSFIYAIKLKIEFIVLNQLLNISKHGIAPRGIHHRGEDVEQIIAAPIKRPSDAALSTRKRLVSFTPFRRRFSMDIPSPRLSFSPANADVKEKPFREVGFHQPAKPYQERNTGHNALANPAATPQSAEDVISSEQRSDDGSFTNSEKQYLGQYGQGVREPRR